MSYTITVRVIPLDDGAAAKGGICDIDRLFLVTDVNFVFFVRTDSIRVSLTAILVQLGSTSPGHFDDGKAADPPLGRCYLVYMLTTC